MRIKLYQRMARLIQAIESCKNNANTDWEFKHEETLQNLVKQYMPSGSGFDNGTSIDLISSTENKLVFKTSFHHMNDNGYYIYWTEHKVTVLPNLAFDFDLKISGHNKRDIKDFIHQTFFAALDTEVEEF